MPLLGVEFLTPGLARKKWAVLERGGRRAVGRELLLLQLRTLIARRLEAAGGAEPGAARGRNGLRGFWQSLQSDAEGALDDFDDLLEAGFGPTDFPLGPLRDLFGDLARWVDEHGYVLAATQAARAAGAEPGDPPLGGRVLIYGLSAEMWGEFFNVAAFARRCAHVTAVLPEPEFGGRTEQDEQWIELWEKLLGADALPLDVEEPPGSCQPVAEAWRGEPAAPVAARLLVGRTRRDEMRRVADAICELLQDRAPNIAVVFPRSDAAHLELVRELESRRVPFADLLETAGPPALEVQAHHALLACVGGGGRLEELLALWPLLRALGTVTLPLAAARRACERTFDLRQTHAIAPHIADWERSAAELARVARSLGEPWPEELPLADALARFRRACAELELDAPEGWSALDVLAATDREPRPAAVLVEALRSFLAPSAAVANAAGRGGFARVTLTTRRRAEGLAWSHIFLVESNARGWPERREPGCWLTDEHRAALNTRRLYPLGLFTSDQRASLERAGYARLARDTATEIIFSAALLADEDPEVKLAPNSWVERIMWANGLAPGGDFERGFARLARSAAIAGARRSEGLEAWYAVWRRRRDPAAPFDEHFFAGDPARITPAALPARLIERGVQDPAELWFDAVLQTRRVPWTPFLRARRKALGQYAHALLAEALAPAESRQGFGPMPAAPEARARLAAALAAQRGRWPPNAYWNSFYAELTHVCRALLDNLHTIPAGPYVATEAWLPAGAYLEVGDLRVPIHGRLDLVRLDQPAWSGAQVDIVDFKTGGDPELSAERMARSGASLQLGVYLAAARSLGVRGGGVWMIKPEPGAVTQLRFEEMGHALTKLRWLEQALARGVYGALTRDRSEYAPPGCDWPLACTPILQAILERKFNATFGMGPQEALDD